MRVGTELLRVELSQGKQVLVEKDVDGPGLEVTLVDNRLSFSRSVVAEDENGDTKHQEAHAEDDHEHFDVFDGLS